MRPPTLAFAAVALLIMGCEAAVPPAPASTPPTPPAAPPAPEGDVPFTGTYQKHAKLAYENGHLVRGGNESTEATLTIQAGKVVYEQSRTADNATTTLAQAYTFTTAAVRALGPDRYEVALVFQGITGDTRQYAPDRDNVKLVAQRTASGWEVDLFMIDTRGRGIGVAFRVGPPPAEAGSLAARLSGVPGTLPPPPDVAAPPRDAVPTGSGLFTRVIAAGTGKDHPGPEDTVQVQYTGWASDGRMIDSSVMRKAPSSFRLGQLIKGWSEGLQLMVVGERRRLWIPAELAYGLDRPGGLPAGDMVFDVELLEITPAKTVQTPPDVAAPPRSAVRTRSGLAYRVLKKGTGKRSPLPTERATVSYSGWTTDGKLFDSSVTRGAPMTFALTAVIKGWAEALQLLKVGDVARFWIPADLAYGQTPTRPGAPAGMLVYDIELVAIP